MTDIIVRTATRVILGVLNELFTRGNTKSDVRSMLMKLQIVNPGT